MKKSLLAALFLTLGLGCGHSQVPPTSWQVSLTWSVPAPAGSWLGCVVGQPSCTYVVSRAVVAAGTGTCPTTAGTAYTPLNQAVPATGTVYNDVTATGLTVCYIVQTVQAGAVSQPSNSAGPFIVPGNPLPPAVTGNLSADLGTGPLMPMTPLPTLALNTPMLHGELRPRN